MADENDKIFEHILNLGQETGEFYALVKGYHSEKNHCLDTCKDQGRRLGVVEIHNGVTDEKVKNMETTIKKMETCVDLMTSKINKIEIRVAGATGAVLIIFEFVRIFIEHR